MKNLNKLRNKLSALLVLALILVSFQKTKACTPMAIPTLSVISVSGGSLNLTWVSNTAWACTYVIELELECLNTNFDGVAPFFVSNSITKPNTQPMNYPVWAINLATLCPGTTYKFRARENNIGGFTPSGWTPTYTFTTPGSFILPIIQPMPNPTICPTNTTQLTAQLQNACGPGSITYSWSPALGLSCSTCSNPIASPTNQTTYTVTVQGGSLSCWTATNAVTVYTSSGSAQVLATATQVSCSNSVAVISLTTAGSASVPASVVWSPAPQSISGNSLVGTGFPSGVVTVTVVDVVGCVKTVTINILPAPPPVSYTIVNLTGSNSITCTNPTINLAVISNYTYGPLTYSWTSPSFTSNTQTVSISAPIPTLTLLGIDLTTNCFLQNTLSIGINTTAPTNTVNPTTQVITCNSGAPVTFSGTVTNPTVNVQHDWYSPLNPLPGGVPIATSNNTISILSGAIPPGVYTLVTTNLVNGCTSQKTVTVTSLSAWPTFSLSSPTNFSVGCAPLNSTTISIINPVSTQTPPATCSYTFLAPTFTGVVTPSVVLGNNSSTTTTLPGTWTVIVQDNSNFCRTTIQVPVLQNTVAPNVSAFMITQTLTCRTPTFVGTGTTTTPFTSITWNVPSTPPTLSTPTLVIGDPANGPNTSTTALTYANFTVVATNSLNACQSTSVVTINQNFKPPISSPTISIATPTAIYCTGAYAPVVLTTGNSTTTSGGGALAFVVNPCWEGPSPQTPTCGPSSYSCYVPGVYSLTIEDNYNGCLKTGTVNVLDRTQPPVITEPVAQATLDCGTSQATMILALTGTMTGGVKYLIDYYPHGAAFSPTNAITHNINPILSGTSSSTINVSEPGLYFYTVTNTLTGCKANGTVEVVPGDLNANFEANPSVGYAPLTVNFTNLSSTSLSSNSIITVWSFGNGTSQTTTSNINTSSIYNAPGSYTVMIISTKGTCVDTAYRVVLAEMPSKLEVPNIFTPNGDGSNDVFFLKVAGIGEIHAIIHDRWGNKVYETNSATGNIAWEGKNFQGAECSAGVYFYIITAKGKDGKEYSSKGNVTLMR
ncbi:MAG: gliding motility-associated C-terminal domain-containing protein [Sphingobacteriaceae bacterium]|nr:gliding motility-associated C-terminal domain-containing protein [Sphingobacteriaceae bacterium]